MDYNMFCYQCQEAANNKGCTVKGVCGKTPEVALMQDLLVYVTKGLSEITTRLRAEGKNPCSSINHLVTHNLFITITNANFDRNAIIEAITYTLEKRLNFFRNSNQRMDSPMQLYGKAMKMNMR